MSLNPVSDAGPLSESELDRLTDFLAAKNSPAMNIEELDGFFAALVAGPDLVLPSEYLPLVFGDDMAETANFAAIEEANEILGLIVRHWNAIAKKLRNGDVHAPILLEDEDGLPRGNDWARGFMRGTELRRAGWARLIADDEHGACLIPAMILCHEHDADPELRSPPIPPERREEIIVEMALGAVRASRYFQRFPSTPSRPARSSGTRKIGRNETCPCGSGRKYKHCCGGVSVH